MRRSRLKRKGMKPKKQSRLSRKGKSVSEIISDAKRSFEKITEAMEKKKTYAYYQIPTVLLNPKVYGGYKGLLKDIKKMIPDAKFKSKIVGKGKLSTRIKISNITPNQAILIASIFILRGGTIDTYQDQ